MKEREYEEKEFREKEEEGGGKQRNEQAKTSFLLGLICIECQN